jgi:hypothetical protein
MTPANPLAILRSAALIILCTSLINCQSSAATQTTSISAKGKAAKPEKPEFPQWVRDIRRAEIIAFGSFPFTMFVATFAMDTGRYFTHDMNLQYAPWPFKSGGAIEMDTDEHKITLFAAIGASVAIALADSIIVRIKRAKVEKQRLSLPEGEVIELRKPWPPDEAAPTEADATETEDAGDTATNNGADGTP